MKWSFWGSLRNIEWCFYSWSDHMWSHIHGFKNERQMRELFWWYINYGNHPQMPKYLKELDNG